MSRLCFLSFASSILDILFVMLEFAGCKDVFYFWASVSSYKFVENNGIDSIEIIGK